MAATRTKTRVSRASTDGAAWAAKQQYRWRSCETCRWGRFHADGLRFIKDALEAKDGGASFAYTDLAAEAKRRFGYPLTDGALRLHHARGCKS